jgi:hypothetical protein
MSSEASNVDSLCLGPLMVLSAPAPMDKIWAKVTGKGNPEAASSGSGSAPVVHAGPEPGAGMDASTLIRTKHKDIVKESKSAILFHGGEYINAVEHARNVVKQGYKPDRIPHELGGGPLDPPDVYKLTKPYARMAKHSQEHVEGLREKSKQLVHPIIKYQKGGASNHATELNGYDEDLKTLKYKWENPPHTHEPIRTLPILHDNQENKAAALVHLDGEKASVQRILAKYNEPHQGN